MKLLHFLISIPVLFFTVSFAVSNGREMPFSLWPFPFEIELPVSFAVLLIGLLFFVAGGAYGWFLGLPVRFEKAAQAKKIREQAKRIAELEDGTGKKDEKTDA